MNASPRQPRACSSPSGAPPRPQQRTPEKPAAPRSWISWAKKPLRGRSSLKQLGAHEDVLHDLLMNRLDAAPRQPPVAMTVAVAGPPSSKSPKHGVVHDDTSQTLMRTQL